MELKLSSLICIAERRVHVEFITILSHWEAITVMITGLLIPHPGYDRHAVAERRVHVGFITILSHREADLLQFGT